MRKKGYSVAKRLAASLLVLPLLLVGGCHSEEAPTVDVPKEPIVLAKTGETQAFRMKFGGVSQEVSQVLWELMETVETQYEGANVLYSWENAEAEPPRLLIGDTGEAASEALKKELGKGHKYAIKVYGSDVVICASNEIMLLEAVTYFKRTYLKTDSDVLSVPGDLDYMYEKQVNWQLDTPIYQGGVRALEVYNAGGGKDSRGTKSRVQVVAETTRQEFDAYLTLLADSGYTQTMRREEADNLYVQVYHAAKNQQLYVYFTGALGEARVIVDEASTLQTDFSYTCADGDVTVYQYALMYNRNGNGSPVGDPYGNCGMFYIIRLADNRLILIDGGDYRQATDAATDALYRFMQEITGKGEDERVDVACWYLTHFHDDHVMFVSNFARRYTTDQINIERIIHNLPDESMAYHVEAIAAHYPDALFVKAHTGQKIRLGNVELEVIFTHEDYLDSFTGRTIVHDGNSTSTVLRLHANGKTVMFAGDWGGGDTVAPEEYATGIARMLAMHGDNLQSDILQVAHHALNPYMEQFNAAVKAQYAFIPAADVAADKLAHPGVILVNVNQVLAAGCAPERIYFASRYTYALHIAQDGEITAAAEQIRGSDVGDNPLTGMVEQDYINETLKAYNAYREPTAQELANWEAIHP